MKLLANLCLVAVSLLAIAGVTELALRQIAVHLPRNYQHLLPPEIALLAQYSKRSVVPTNYVALVGDSYAEGAGDWYANTHSKFSLRRSPFHSADVIFQRTCADVVSFGRGGAGSYGGLVYRPITLYEALRSRGTQIEQPRVIVIYFYEGNDLDDNKKFLSRYEAYHKRESTPQDALHAILRGMSKTGIIQRSYLGTALTSIARGLNRRFGTQRPPDNASGPRNLVRVNGRVESIPPAQQSPSVELDEQELESSMAVFRDSASYLKSYFKDSEFIVVYLPSTMSVYEIESPQVSIQRQSGGPPALIDQRLIGVRSDDIAQRVMQVARDQNMTYLDFRIAARAAGRDKFIHGPGDWRHFNRAGYELLGAEVAKSVDGLGIRCP